MEQEQIVGILLGVITVYLEQDVAWIGRVTVQVEKSKLIQGLLKIQRHLDKVIEYGSDGEGVRRLRMIDYLLLY